MQRRKGFNLVELAMVIAIVAVVAATATPRYARAMVNYRIDRAARQIVADLERARSAARTAGHSVTVDFDLEGGLITLTGVNDLDSHSGNHVTHLAGEPWRAVLSSASFGGDRRIVFNAFGEPDSGGSVVVRVADKTRTVRIRPSSGKAQIE